MSTVTFIIVLFALLIVLLVFGIPVAFAMSGLSIILGYVFQGGDASLVGYVTSTFNKFQNLSYTAIPMYIFMAGILRYSNLADDMYETMYRWLGGLKGGLAAGTAVISSLFGAMVGLSSVATATLGVSAKPSMTKRGYDPKFTAGIIMSGSQLGIIIPPSVTMLIYATVTQVSPGKMFIAGVVPGLILMVVFIIFCIIYGMMNPTKAPALPKEERYTMREKLSSLKGMALPLALMLFVIGSILSGICTATEAASIGVVGSLLAAAFKKQLTFENFKKMLTMTIGLTASVFWLVIGATAFARVTSTSQIGQLVSSFVAEMTTSPYLILAVVVVFFVFIGMFMDASAAIFMLGPILVPLLTGMNFDLIWFGIIYVLLVCIGNLSPPFGISLFVMRGVSNDTTMRDLWVAVIPGIVIYVLGIIFFMIFPDLVLWLPSTMK